MKRIVALAVLTVLFVMALALPAAAEYPPSGVGTEPAALPNVVQGPSGSAFTGSTLVPLVVLGAALLLVGTALILFSRRRRTTAKS